MVNVPWHIYFLASVIALDSVLSISANHIGLNGSNTSNTLETTGQKEGTSQPTLIPNAVHNTDHVSQQNETSISKYDDYDDSEIPETESVGVPSLTPNSSATSKAPEATTPKDPKAPMTTEAPKDTTTTTEYIPDAPRLPRLCLLEPEEGYCESHEESEGGVRYFFNALKKECDVFLYSGCNGNENNFEHETECQERCQVGQPYDTKEDARLPEVCKQRVVKGTCQSGKDPVLRYFYNQYSQKCELFTFSGCQANENNFETREECEARCIYTPNGACALPSDKGFCSMNWTRYYWNKELGDCREFIYTGCAGNSNNFKSKEECRKYCKAKSTFLALWDKVWEAMQSWAKRGYS